MVWASMQVSSSRRPGILGSSLMGSFDVRFMPCFVAHGHALLHQKQRRAKFWGSVQITSLNTLTLILSSHLRSRNFLPLCARDARETDDCGAAFDTVDPQSLASLQPQISQKHMMITILTFDVANFSPYIMDERKEYADIHMMIVQIGADHRMLADL